MTAPIVLGLFLALVSGDSQGPAFTETAASADCCVDGAGEKLSNAEQRFQRPTDLPNKFLQRSAEPQMPRATSVPWLRFGELIIDRKGVIWEQGRRVGSWGVDGDRWGTGR